MVAAGRYVVLFSAALRTLPALETAFKGDHSIYALATTDFESFGDPWRFFGDQFTNVALIDCYVMEHDGTYHAFVKIEADNLAGAGAKRGLHHTTARSFDGPWSALEPIPGAGGRTEGPFVIRVGETWILYGDAPHFAARSADLTRWEPITDRVRLPSGYTHGTATRVPDHLIAALE